MWSTCPAAAESSEQTIPCPPTPKFRTYLWANGQSSKAVTLEDVGACVVHHDVGRMLLKGSLEVPLHFIQVLVILGAPLQLYLPPDGL